jgi:hypothetical protein
MEYSLPTARQMQRVEYRLDDEHLRMRLPHAGGEVAIPYVAIHTVEVRRPMPRLMTTRVLSSVGVIVIESLELTRFGGKINHTREYAQFVRALLDRLAQRGLNVRIVVGSSTTWWIGLAVGAFATLLTVLLLVGLAFGGVVLAPAFLAIPLVYLLVWALMRSGRTRTVGHTSVPEYCLPVHAATTPAAPRT